MNSRNSNKSLPFALFLHLDLVHCYCHSLCLCPLLFYFNQMLRFRSEIYSNSGCVESLIPYHWSTTAETDMGRHQLCLVIGSWSLWTHQQTNLVMIFIAWAATGRWWKLKKVGPRGRGNGAERHAFSWYTSSQTFLSSLSLAIMRCTAFLCTSFHHSILPYHRPINDGTTWPFIKTTRQSKSCFLLSYSSSEFNPKDYLHF